MCVCGLLSAEVVVAVVFFCLSNVVLLAARVYGAELAQMEQASVRECVGANSLALSDVTLSLALRKDCKHAHAKACQKSRDPAASGAAFASAAAAVAVAAAAAAACGAAGQPLVAIRVISSA